MLVEQTMLQMMVAMVMTCLIPAVTYAVQGAFNMNNFQVRYTPKAQMLNKHF